MPPSFQEFLKDFNLFKAFFNGKNKSNLKKIMQILQFIHTLQLTQIMFLSKGIYHKFIFLSLFVCLALNYLVVHSPASLKQFFIEKYGGSAGNIPVSIANFGDVPYGRTIIGQVDIPTVLENCVYEDIPNINKTQKIILSERNDCKFTQKALNTQMQGGIMSIIMDSIIENPSQVIMVDDGHGAQVHIPTILISKDDGDKILNTLSNQKVVVSMRFDTLKTDVVSINLYLDIADRNTFVFLRRFEPYFNKIKDYVKMKVNYATISCKNCPTGDCFYNGSYCKKIIYSWVAEAGQLYIKEQLREYFIYQEYPNQWWRYMDLFDEYCTGKSEENYMEDCSEDIMKKLKMDSDKIHKLVAGSFQQTTNPVLEESYQQRLYSQIVYYPSIVVNNITYRGNLQPYEVEEMVCSSLNNPPASCTQDPKETRSSHVTTWVILSVGGFLGLIVFIIFCYRRVVRRQLTNRMNKQVNELVNQYITMYEADKFRGDQELIQNRHSEN